MSVKVKVFEWGEFKEWVDKLEKLIKQKELE